jgi:hypothetical protein
MQRRWSWAAALAAIVLRPAAVARAADTAAPPVFEGTWIATAGPAVFHGRWSAQALPGRRDEMQGSWSILNDAGETTARGTWSAQRSKRGFQGKWFARPASGGLLSGTFEAHLPGFKGKALEDMFAATKTQQIAGFWRMGNARGNWYLKAPAPSAP